MENSIENQSSTETSEDERDKRSIDIWHTLAGAFGGYSQVPDKVIGMALVGQINNNGLEFGQDQLDAVVDAICERWEDVDLDPDKIRNEIIEGMKDMAKTYKGEVATVDKAIRSVESRKE